MKILITLSLLLSAQLTFAASLDSDINLLARKVSARAQSSQRLSQDEKIRLIKALNTADTILARVAETDNGGSQPTKVVCSSEPAAEIQKAYRIIQAFAFVTKTGLDLSMAQSKVYATEWMAKYPCARAQPFTEDFKTIKDFAYSKSGLDMSLEKAREYGLKHVDGLCPRFDLFDEFKVLFNFAYSTTGLSLNRLESISYAKETLEGNVFSCIYR